MGRHPAVSNGAPQLLDFFPLVERETNGDFAAEVIGDGPHGAVKERPSAAGEQVHMLALRWRFLSRYKSPAEIDMRSRT